MAPWHFLLPLQYYSVHLLQEAEILASYGDYIDILPDKFPCKNPGNILPPGIPAEKKMPNYLICTDSADNPDFRFCSYNSAHYKKESGP